MVFNKGFILKLKCLCFFWFLFFPFFLYSQEAGNSIFTGIQVHNISLQFDQPNYWDSLTAYYNNGNEQYLSANVLIDSSITLDSIGVRLKGNSSYSHPNNKKSMKLDFNLYRDGQRWNGVKGVHLNNCFSDPSFMREKLHMDFCRDAGIPAPRANYAMVYINGQVFGLYTLIETIDKKFLSSRFGNSEGNLYKAIDAFGGGGPGGGNQVVSDFKWINSTESSYYSRYELKTDDAVEPWTDLVDAINIVNNSTDLVTSLPQKVNLTGLYRSLGADILFANLDSYVESGRNFYVYFNSYSGKLEWIVWDANMSFGSYPGTTTKAEQVILTYTSNAANRPLAGKIFNNTHLKNNYLRSFYKLFNNYFNSSRMFPHIDSIANVIRPYVNADTRKQYTAAQFETNINNDINETGGGPGGGGRKPGIKSFITLRQANIQSQLANLNLDWSDSFNTGDVVINEFMSDNNYVFDPEKESDDWIELYNNTNKDIDLSGMFLSDTDLQLTKWEFPANSIINAKSYLVIWADNDTAASGGIHCNFKLSSDADNIIFSDVSGNIVDSISFSTQATDKSLARIPNGTGSFIISDPTFNSENKESVSGIEARQIDQPGEYYVAQNYPNPFNPSTNISYYLPGNSYVRLKVYDLLGSEVTTLVDSNQEHGKYDVIFSGSSLASGTYILSFSVQPSDGKWHNQFHKMLLLK